MRVESGKGQGARDERQGARGRWRVRGKALLILAACLLLVAGVPVLAQVSANYDLSWHVVAGGGGRMASTGHTLLGTIGQPVTGVMFSSGHSGCSGFWCGGAPVQYRIYLPLVVKNR